MILLPGDKQLNAANWVTRGLLDELAAQPDLPSPLVDKVRWCLDAALYTLDLRDAPPATLDALSRALDPIIADTEKRGAASFQQPDMFPAFLAKLRELRVLLNPAGARLAASFVFDVGSENAPDSPTGLERFQLMPSGRFRFHNRQRGQLLAERTGTLAPAAVEEIAGYLAGAGFPHVPDHPRPPGADYLTISSAGRSALLNVPTARRFPGYGPLIRRLLPWLSYLVKCEGPPPPELELDPP